MILLLFLFCFLAGVWVGSNHSIGLYYKYVVVLAGFSFAWGVWLARWFSIQDYGKSSNHKRQNLMQ